MAFTHLATQTVTGSTATSITFSSISQSYQHLYFKGHTSSTDHRSGTQYAYDLIEVQYNGYTTSGWYQYQDTASLGHNSGWGTSGNNEGGLAHIGGDNSYFMCQWDDPNTKTGGGTQTSPCFGDWDYWIGNYTQSASKLWSPSLWQSHSVGDNTGDYWGRGWGAGNWFVAAAITQVNFALSVGSFNVKSVISMYGLEAS